MEGRNASIDDLVKEGLEAAVQARELIWKFTTLQITQEEFRQELEAIHAKQIVFDNWQDFQDNEAIYPCLEIFQVIYSIAEDVDYQIRFYGLDSLREDIKQLDTSIKILKRYLGYEN
ncbi:MAG: hypothetical protein ACYC21_05090, partial [Eubacteriales bacterium]